MKKLVIFLVLIPAFFIVSCSSGSKKDSPSPFDAQWQNTGKVYKGKKFKQVMTWAPGQYVVSGNIIDGKKDSISRFLVVGKEKGGWVFETTSTSLEGKLTGMQMLITGYERAVNTGETDEIKVVWMKMLQEDGTVQQMDETLIMVNNFALKSTWSKLINVNASFGDGGAVTVPAGTFASTSKAKTKVKVFFKTFETTTWLHADVPVNGLVKAASDDGKNITELISFGYNGKPIIK